MDGITFTLTIVGILVGAIVSYLVSKHFFQKSVKKKSITPYIQFSSQLFSDLDPELRENLILKYKNLSVENIAQAQFLVANDGDIPIRDIIKPLRLTLPVENKIFSINIIHIQPEGREIKYNVIETDFSNIIEFDIPLMNAGEFFVFKVLLQDLLPKEENSTDTEADEERYPYKFTITADELPPQLSISHLPYSYYEQEKKSKYDWTFFWIGTISLFVFILIVGTIYSFKFQSKSLYILAPSEFFAMSTFSFFNVCILLLTIVGILIFILALIGIIGAISELKPDEKPKFRVPSKLRRERKFSPFEFFE